MKKRGRFSVEEVQFIEQNCEALSPQAIADQVHHVQRMLT